MIEGVVSGADVTMGKRRSLVVRLGDGTGVLSLRFYHFSNAQKEGLKRGTHLRCYGEARPGASGLEIYHPEYRALNGNEPAPPVEQTLTPIYPSTEGLTQQRLRLLCQQSLAMLGPRSLPDWLPEELARDYHLAPLDDAIRYLHNPPADADLDELAEGQHWAQHRLAFEELLTHQLSQQRLRESLRALRAPVLPKASRLPAQYLANLGFSPTGAQQRVGNEIAYDLSQPEPMMRLVQGDVGAGKTVVAALAALQALEAGYQVALMAPTEILAEQHYLTFKRWLEPLGIEVAWLAGKLKGKARASAFGADRQRCADGGRDPCAVPGRSEVSPPGPGDHRRAAPVWRTAAFGLTPERRGRRAVPAPVDHDRHPDSADAGDERLRRPGHLHPRRVAPGRTPVNTVLVADSRRFEVVERVRAACAEGRQAYWVCTLIEESEELTCQAAESTFEELGSALGELRVGLIHGRMKPAEKSRGDGRVQGRQSPVAGGDHRDRGGRGCAQCQPDDHREPRAPGLAQLHQLRGRVGRGSAVSHCVLLYHPPLSQIGRERLGIMRETNDGFVIAEKDLELRGPGEMLGTRQTGLLQFKVADLMRDADLLPAVRDAAQALLARWPDHVSPLLDRWLRHGQQYGQV